jgi:4-hydroxy-tetrahydrodipicolinate synthase
VVARPVPVGNPGPAARRQLGEHDARRRADRAELRHQRDTLPAGPGSNDTRASAQALAELKAWPEVSAALTVVPYYTRPSEQGVIAHFTALASQSPVPLAV